MTLSEKLSGDIKAAMIAKDAERLNTLRLLKSAMGYAQIEQKKESLNDAEIISILQKEVKKRRDSIEQFEKGGRPELAAKERAEAIILESYLPQALSEAELQALVEQAIKDTGAQSKKDMGGVIKAVQAKAAGRADGKTISTLVGKLLP